MTRADMEHVNKRTDTDGGVEKTKNFDPIALAHRPEEDISASAPAADDIELAKSFRPMLR